MEQKISNTKTIVLAVLSIIMVLVIVYLLSILEEKIKKENEDECTCEQFEELRIELLRMYAICPMEYDEKWDKSEKEI